MNELYMRNIIAGILLGLWPIVMNRSGLTGNLSAAVFSGAAFAITIPFAIQTGIAGTVSGWAIGISAGVIAGIGIILFNGVLARAPKEIVGSLFITMITVQIMIPITTHILVNREISIKHVVGFAAAIVAVIFLR